VDPAGREVEQTRRLTKRHDVAGGRVDKRRTSCDPRCANTHDRSAVSCESSVEVNLMGNSDPGIRLRVYSNGDHTCLVWLPSGNGSIQNCRGFSIRRKKNNSQDFLHGVVGFSDDDKLDPSAPWKFPLQRYMWWDYHVKPGDVVQYSVVPVVGPDKDHLELGESLASPLTEPLTVSDLSTPHLSAFFNKGIVAAQWVSRALDQVPAGSNIKDLVATPGDALRNALSGLLRTQILSLLADVQAKNGKIFAALYELNDPELISSLEAFGPDCSLILANGAFGPGEDDENRDVRTRLRQESKINLFDRLVSRGHFAHNKFVVFCDSDGKPERVLTGSTNWTASGLCTQANNGLVIDDPDVAQDFLDAWNRLKAAGNAYTPDLIAGNSTSKTYEIDGCKVTPWFVKTSDHQDLDDARALIAAAEHGILFLFFNPGTRQEDPVKETLLQDILQRQDKDDVNFDPNLYIRGVVNQQIAGLTTPDAPPGSPPATTETADAHSSLGSAPAILVGTKVHELEPVVLVPHNIKSQFHEWEKELLGAGMVNVHSKVVVLDPFGANPVVMTGSHNLGIKASRMNDDNLVIIQGNSALAIAYAVNIVAIYQTYRWNSYVEQHRADPSVWHGLVDNDRWQGEYLTGSHLAEIEFWLGTAAVETV
jgi:phosphatidylserine/phosphatidylglycerophosphate/cardiolipin synthase-like enzyme